MMLALTAPVCAGQTAPSFDQLYAQGQAANKGLRTLTAHFVETTSNALLRADRPIVARGLLFVERPSRVTLRPARGSLSPTRTKLAVSFKGV